VRTTPPKKEPMMATKKDSELVDIPAAPTKAVDSGPRPPVEADAPSAMGATFAERKKARESSEKRVAAAANKAIGASETK
jgi:hypothetical protein